MMRSQSQTSFQGGLSPARKTITSGGLSPARKSITSVKRLSPASRKSTKTNNSKLVLLPGKEHLRLLAMARKKREAVGTSLPKPLGASVLAAMDESGYTPLALAVSSVASSSDIVRSLLKYKAPLESTDSRGNTPLMLSAVSGLVPVVRQLIEASAHVGKRNKDGQRALDLAQTSAVRALLTAPTVQTLAGLSRPLVGLSCTDARHADGEHPLHRLRLEALPAQLPAHLLEVHVRTLLRRLGLKDPERVEVPVDPISRMPRGYAYVDFREASKAAKLLRGDVDSLCGSTVHVVLESSGA